MIKLSTRARYGTRALLDLAKSFKVSTSAASKEQLEFVIDSFKDILQKHHSMAA
jgi:Cys-tRNA synthase (O-phospho-L-seryl-tRNA:Cys-tRNA synthase)